MGKFKLPGTLFAKKEKNMELFGKNQNFDKIIGDQLC